jgi:DNA invertase Pin-like site-specific DNA recombinase
VRGTEYMQDTRFAIYSRISCDRVGAGLGVERQQQDCKKLVAQLGGQLVATYSDNDISAYSGKHRPTRTSPTRARCLQLLKLNSVVQSSQWRPQLPA